MLKQHHDKIFQLSVNKTKTAISIGFTEIIHMYDDMLFQATTVSGILHLDQFSVHCKGNG